MPRESTLINDVEGDPIVELQDIVDDRTVGALYRLIDFVDEPARIELRRLLTRIKEQRLKPTVYVHPVRSRKHPYAIGWDDNARPWQRAGNLYLYPLIGRAEEGKLSPAAEGKEDAIWIWCCLAAA